MESDETNFPCSNSRPGSYGLFSQNTTSPELRAQLEFHCIAAGVYGNGTLTSWRGGNGWPNNRYATWERGLFNSMLICSCWNCIYEYYAVNETINDKRSELSWVTDSILLIKSWKVQKYRFIGATEIGIMSRLLSYDRYEEKWWILIILN